MRWLDKCPATSRFEPTEPAVPQCAPPAGDSHSQPRIGSARDVARAAITKPTGGNRMSRCRRHRTKHHQGGVVLRSLAQWTPSSCRRLPDLSAISAGEAGALVDVGRCGRLPASSARDGSCHQRQRARNAETRAPGILGEVPGLVTGRPGVSGAGARFYLERFLIRVPGPLK